MPKRDLLIPSLLIIGMLLLSSTIGQSQPRPNQKVCNLLLPAIQQAREASIDNQTNVYSLKWNDITFKVSNCSGEGIDQREYSGFNFEEIKVTFQADSTNSGNPSSRRTLQGTATGKWRYKFSRNPASISGVGQLEFLKYTDIKGEFMAQVSGGTDCQPGDANADCKFDINLDGRLRSASGNDQIRDVATFDLGMDLARISEGNWQASSRRGILRILIGLYQDDGNDDSLLPPGRVIKQHLRDFDGDKNCLIGDIDFFDAVDEWIQQLIDNELFFRAIDAWIGRINICEDFVSTSELAHEWRPSASGQSIRFAGNSRTSNLRLQVFDIQGKLLVDQRDVGPVVTWDLRDSIGRSIPNGIYFYRFVADGANSARLHSALRKIFVLR